MSGYGGYLLAGLYFRVTLISCLFHYLDTKVNVQSVKLHVEAFSRLKSYSVSRLPAQALNYRKMLKTCPQGEI